MNYIARQKKNDNGEVLKEQPLIEHLESVACLSKSFARCFGMEAMGEFLGLLHDIGKYSDQFQERVRGADKRVDHTTAGGQVLNKTMNADFDLLANCIFGHHGGLLNQGAKADIGHHDNERSVWARKGKKIGEGQIVFADYSAYTSELKLRNPAPKFLEACAEFIQMPVQKKNQNSFTWPFLTRMLFSCLVDADFLDTEKFIRGDIGRSNHDSINFLLEKLNQKLATFTNIEDLNKYRSDILKDCIEKSQGAKGLYSLTVPTGGGKTLSSMAFALNHAKKHGMQRVIYVIPYTSIIEQNAKVFSDVFGERNVLENHSNAEYDNHNDKKYHYLASENWDIPIVVTTNVQFFESLFSHKTSKVRKLHNIANSVIIFDEAQMLPTDYLKPCVYAIEELVRNYSSTAVLCTATQPSLHLVFSDLIELPREICGNFNELYANLKRVTYESIGILNNSELLAKLNATEQVLCIVNSRKHAQDLFKGLEGDGNYHLSTLMYPEHRKKKLSEIGERLKAGLPVKVISTSLIEAGVDVDFGVVYRVKAGLDSIIQAGGRCNREGKRALETSKVYIFETDPKEYKQPRGLMLNISATDHALRQDFEIDSPEAIKSYFDYLYRTKGDSLDKKEIVDRFQKSDIKFEDISNEFKFIENNGKTIFIPKDKEAESLLNKIKYVGMSKSLYRQLGRYSVNILTYEYDNLKEQNAFETIEDIIVLRDLEIYSNEVGLKVDFELKINGIFY